MSTVCYALLSLISVLEMAIASPVAEPHKIFDGSSLQEVTLEHVVNRITPGTIVIASEIHSNSEHHRNQARLLEAISETGMPLYVGMEFIDYTKQSSLDAYLMGLVEESRFLKDIDWGGGDFANYRTQVLLPTQSGGWTYGINSPRFLTTKIAKEGLKSLTRKERKFLPPDFERGNAEYFERFKEVMSGHVNKEELQRYFSAQSVWDDTMAYVSTRLMKNHSGGVMVIIVGDFHAAYGGGLPDRIRARGYQKIVNISQVELSGTKDDWQLITPHPTYGPRSDFIWTSDNN